MKKGKTGPRFGITILFTFVAIIEMILALAIVLLLSFVLHISNTDVSEVSLIWIFAIIIGGITAWFVNKVLLYPIKRLSDAMDAVAKGDFDIRIESNNKIREIQNICERFNQMTSELRSTEILQSDFISNVSHEIKTPITSIEGYATLLQNPEITEDHKKQFIQKILFNTKRLSELVGNILLLSKIENQTIETKRKRYRLDEQIRQSLLMLEPKWVQKEIDFDVDLESVIYNGNEHLLQHVWNNLIDNAIKFSPQGGMIRMRLETQGMKHIFTIEDEGAGISDENKIKIFTKFYQADGSRKQEGNGLGLALVKQILSVSDGEIMVENREQKGCRFIVILKE